ncbi:MAG TPA: cupredoxin domain-containing protein [Dehalococcoidia bacterium]|nr:cupredoxin domain-containing protein [Dehalococcoidia bacterium]
MLKRLRLLVPFFALALALVVSGHGVLGQNASVAVGDNFYSPSAITVSAGATVTWTNNGPSAHTVTSTDGIFDSGYSFTPGSSFSYTFSTPGTYPYYCLIHGTIQSGTVTVQGSSAPPPQPTEPPSVPTQPAPVPVITQTQEASPGNEQPPSPSPTATATAGASPTPSPSATGPLAVAQPGAGQPTDGSGGDSNNWWLFVVIPVAVIATGAAGYAFYRMRNG